jgi:tRNA threonylcarbamoyladenosine biosynthesis protein TsaE
MHIPTSEDMHALGVQLGRLLRAGDLVLLDGPLGAGKTTLTRGIGEGLGVRGPITSPTFVIARQHPSLADGPGLVHVDAYRVQTWNELEDLGIAFDLDRNVVVAEWAAGRLEGIADAYVTVHISRHDDDDEEREVVIETVGQRWEGVDVPACT